MAKRPSLIEADDLSPDLEAFEPKKIKAPDQPTADEVRLVADIAKFSSRTNKSIADQSATRPSAVAADAQQRQPRTYRTGRTASFATKVMPATLEAIYVLAERHQWRVGETIEKAIEALLQKEGL